MGRAVERQWQVTNLAFHGCFVKPLGGVEFRPVMNCATYHCVWKVLVPALPVFNHTRDLKKAESEKKITLIESFPSRQMAAPFLSRTQFYQRRLSFSSHCFHLDYAAFDTLALKSNANKKPEKPTTTE